MIFKFSPSDFEYRLDYADACVASQLAQAKLDEWLSTGVKVYGIADSAITEWSNHKHSEYNHEALLINIKPIERECPHEAVPIESVYVTETTGWLNKCKHCGLKLKATWQVCDE